MLRTYVLQDGKTAMDRASGIQKSAIEDVLHGRQQATDASFQHVDLN